MLENLDIHMQNDDVEGFPTSNAKINLKWIKDFFEN